MLLEMVLGGKALQEGGGAWATRKTDFPVPRRRNRRQRVFNGPYREK